MNKPDFLSQFHYKNNAIMQFMLIIFSIILGTSGYIKSENGYEQRIIC